MESSNPRFGIRNINKLALAGIVVVAAVIVAIYVLGASGGNTQGATAGDARATLVLTGDVNESYEFTGISGDVLPTSTLIAALWTDPQVNTMNVSGELEEGTRATSNLFAIGWVVGEEAVNFTSKSGECEVTIDLQDEGLTGSFTCAGVPSTDGSMRVNATGTFSQ